MRQCCYVDFSKLDPLRAYLFAIQMTCVTPEVQSTETCRLKRTIGHRGIFFLVSSFVLDSRQSSYCSEAMTNPISIRKLSSCEEKWNRRILELARYKEKHGDCNVPKGFPENKGLGLWVATQRKQYRMRQIGKHSQLTDERLKQLQSLGFKWNVREQGSQVWKKRCQALIEYRQKHGDCSVPQKYPEDKALGGWVNDQRKQYKYKQEGRRTTLTDARIKELETIGFVWKEREIECIPWEHHVRELIEYRKKHGDCKVPFHYSENKSLAHWVANQRTHYKLKKAGKYSPMTDDRIRELESIGFVWSCRDQASDGDCSDSDSDQHGNKSTSELESEESPKRTIIESNQAQPITHQSLATDRSLLKLRHQRYSRMPLIKRNSNE
eukprot:scaffold3214_cov113-Cylindrotheca_fusiformis.AAC.6